MQNEVGFPMETIDEVPEEPVKVKWLFPTEHKGKSYRCKIKQYGTYMSKKGRGFPVFALQRGEESFLISCLSIEGFDKVVAAYGKKTALWMDKDLTIDSDGLKWTLIPTLQA